MNTLEQQRIAAYTKLKEQKQAVDKLGLEYAKARAAYQAAYEEYVKLDVEIATANRKIIKGREMPERRIKEKDKREELRELAKQVGMKELLSILEEA